MVLNNMKRSLHAKLSHLYRNLFTGHHSVVLVIGFTTGGMLIGRSLWQYLYDAIGLGLTTLVGLGIFILCGIYMNQFYDITEKPIESVKKEG